MNKSKVGYVGNIENETEENEFFRKVLFTSGNRISQLVVMALKPSEEIGMETHAEHDQFIRIESGTGKVILNGEENYVSSGDAIVIPAGTEHNLVNTSETEKMKLYTVYTPAEHAEDRIDIEKPQ